MKMCWQRLARTLLVMALAGFVLQPLAFSLHLALEDHTFGRIAHDVICDESPEHHHRATISSLSHSCRHDHSHNHAVLEHLHSDSPGDPSTPSHCCEDHCDSSSPDALAMPGNPQHKLSPAVLLSSVAFDISCGDRCAIATASPLLAPLAPVVQPCAPRAPPHAIS